MVVDVDAPDLVTANRRQEALLAAPPPEVAEELDRYDPDGRALVLVAPFLATARVGDRMVYGARRPEWVALEDKARDHLLLDAAGVAHPDFLLAPPERDVLTGAAARLDRGGGTVWAGDAREGVNGAGEYVRWIREAHVDDTHEAVTFLRAHCDRVRIAPFVEGLPCSIHGLVTDDGVAVFRPVELVMLRPSAGARFRYAGAGTFWDPAPVDGEAMRGAPRRVGNVLRERVGLRGMFGIDGILGEDGFVATELNPRFAAGLGYVTAALPELAFDLLHRVVAAGDGHEVVAADLDTVVVDAADGRRWGAGWATAGRSWPRTGHHRLVALGDGHRPATDEEEADAL